MPHQCLDIGAAPSNLIAKLPGQAPFSIQDRDGAGLPVGGTPFRQMLRGKHQIVLPAAHAQRKISAEPRPSATHIGHELGVDLAVALHGIPIGFAGVQIHSEGDALRALN